MDVNNEAKNASDCICKRERLQDRLEHLSTLPVAGKGLQSDPRNGRSYSLSPASHSVVKFDMIPLCPVGVERECSRSSSTSVYH